MCFSSQPAHPGNFAACTDSSHDIPIILKTAFTVKLLYPNDRAVEPASLARGAVSWQVREQMLCRFVLIVRTGLCAACGNSCGRLYPNGSDAEVFSSARVAGNYLVRTQILARVSAGGLQALHPIVGRRSLSVSHAMPTVALPVGKCFPVLCLSRPLFLHTVH